MLQTEGAEDQVHICCWKLREEVEIYLENLKQFQKIKLDH